jgi:hypothetical protein
MIKKVILAVLCIFASTCMAIVTIKNDTKVPYFITCDKIGCLIDPQKEVQLDIQEANWLKSWWFDPSLITLYKKIGDTSEFQATFEIKPTNKSDENILIFISDVQRKARHVSAPFSVRNISTNEADLS